MMNKATFIFLLLTLLLILASCEEMLPLRNDPTNALVASVRKLYVYNPGIENGLYIFLVVKNNYDETIESKAVVDGTLRIKWYPPEDYTVGFVNEKNVKLTLKDIQTGKYNEKTGLLLIDPGDSLVLMYRWDFLTDDKSDMLLKFKYYNTTCYQVSEKQVFEVTANVKLFVQTSILYAQPLVVNQCFISQSFGSGDPKGKPCPPINPENPCSVLLSP